MLTPMKWVYPFLTFEVQFPILIVPISFLAYVLDDPFF